MSHIKSKPGFALRYSSGFAICLIFVFWPLLVAQAPADETLLTVTGEGGKVLRLTAADLAKLPRQTTQAADRGQEAVSYEGVPLVEVLKLAGTFLVAHTVRNPVYASFAVLVGLLVWINLASRFILFTAAWTATRRVILSADARGRS